MLSYSILFCHVPFYQVVAVLGIKRTLKLVAQQSWSFCIRVTTYMGLREQDPSGIFDNVKK
jgi:hypothetical protein